MEQRTASADQLEQLAEVLSEYLSDKDAHRENTLNYLYPKPEHYWSFHGKCGQYVP